MSKPIVHFRGTPNFMGVDPYSIAKVYAVDHPKLPTGVVWTSAVIKKNEDGSFETLNTLYKPYKENNDLID